jgi:tripartite-type tricarboxylate transporter receptor subunit TctC
VAIAPAIACAQSYPAKPVRLITPTGAGGSLDTTARLLATKMTDLWGSQVFVENRPGAGGQIGAGAAAKSAPDGYTLLVASNGNLTTTQALYKNVPYDVVRDFAPISLVATNPYVLVVHPSLPAKNMRELIALAKAKPGKIDAASSGNGSTPHLALELLNSMAGIKLMHVPYKTSSAGLMAIVSGEASLMFTGVVSAQPFVDSARLRALAVGSDKRIAVLPNVPTIAESGVPGFEASNWVGMLAPAGTPPAILSQVHSTLAKVLQMPDVRDVMKKHGLEIVGSSPDQFGRFMKSEIVKWTKVVKASGAHID